MMISTPDAERHQVLLTKYSIPRMGDHSAVGGRLSQILNRLDTSHVLSNEDKQFIRDKGLFDLSNFVAKLEETGQQDFKTLKARAENQSNKNRRRDLFRKYQMDWVESEDLGKVLRILEAVDGGARISDNDALWLSAHEYFSPELKRIFHRHEAEFHRQTFLNARDPWQAVNASSHYRKADMAQEALTLLTEIDVEEQRNKHLKAALLTTKGGAFRDLRACGDALQLAERAHSTDPESFHPCTLIGALKYELGDYASGATWFARAVERGATSSAIDHELRVIIRRADKLTKERLKQHLLQIDPDRFGWVRSKEL